MSDPRPAIDYVIKNEGGLSDHPADKGGVTKYGVTLETLRRMPKFGQATEDTVRNLTLRDAHEIYLSLWWLPYYYQRIESQAIATKVLDLAVNFGQYQGTIIAQRAANRAGARLAVDGIMGPKTRAALSASEPSTLMPWLMVEAARVYLAIAMKDQSQNVFLAGWLRRAMRQPERLKADASA